MPLIDSYDLNPSSTQRDPKSVYFFGGERRGNDVVKIGRSSNDPMTRRKSIESHYGIQFCLLFFFEAGKTEEKRIHKEYEHLNIKSIFDPQSGDRRTELFYRAGDLKIFVDKVSNLLRNAAKFGRTKTNKTKTNKTKVDGISQYIHCELVETGTELYCLEEVKIACDRIANSKGEATSVSEKSWKSVLVYLNIAVDPSAGWKKSHCNLDETVLLLAYFFSKKMKVISNPNNARPSEVQLREVMNNPVHEQKLKEYFSLISRSEAEEIFGRDLIGLIKLRTGVSVTEKTLYEWGNSPKNPCPSYRRKTAYNKLEISYWIKSALKLSDSTESKQGESAKANGERKTSKRPPNKPPTLPVIPVDTSAKTILSEDARAICSVALAERKNQQISEESSKLISKAQWQRHRGKMDCTNKWMSWEELSTMLAYEAAKVFDEDAFSSEEVQQWLVHSIEIARENNMIRT